MSKSRSSSSQATSYVDNRAVLGEGALYANNGATITSTNYVLDGGAINRAFDHSERTMAGATDFGTRALDSVDHAIGTAGAFAQDVVRQAFNFGQDAVGESLAANRYALQQAYNFGQDAVGESLAANRYATQQAFNFGQDALALTDSAMDRALDYSTATTNAALSNLQATQQLTADAYENAKGRGALTDKIIIGAIGAMALVAFVALRSKKGAA